MTDRIPFCDEGRLVRVAADFAFGDDQRLLLLPQARDGHPAVQTREYGDSARRRVPRLQSPTSHFASAQIPRESRSIQRGRKHRERN